MRGLAGSISRAVEFLEKAQLPDGSYVSWSSKKQRPFTADKTYATTFTPALILAALAGLPDASAVTGRLATWLRAQKSSNWSFNYWAKDAPERRSLPYPDDLDDTFCALTALYKHNPESLDGAALAAATQLLVAAEQTVGGPYRTWLVGSDAPSIWQDVDLAVNANIAYFLRLLDGRLPNLAVFLEAAVARQDFSSPYYPSVYPVLYYLARASPGDKRRELADAIVSRQQNGFWQTPLQTALMCTALHELGEPSPTAALQHLLSSQQPDGSWPAEAFCLDPARRGVTYFSGAPALTTALALEALTAARVPAAALAQPIDKQAAQLSRRIHAAAEREVQTLPLSLRTEMQAALTAIRQGAHQSEITLLPYLFARSLSAAPQLSTSLLIDLGLANLYGWAAYTLFDDILDNQAGPRQMPAASVLLRHSVSAFDRALPNAPHFQKLVQATFDVIDGANTWEVAHCRAPVSKTHLTLGALPKYGRGAQLYQKSLGHSLTPLAVLLAQGITAKDVRFAALRRGLTHYLFARQLNDDMHDWEQDVRTGQLSFVVAAICQQLALEPGRYTLGSLILRMQRQFWHHTLIDMCALATKHTTAARRNFIKAGIAADTPIMELVNRLDRAVVRALREQADAEQFLAAFTKKRVT
ncbi:MAG TPA: hypothetical protein VLF91_02895 [Candidatus Saccharimonadales bacterium]|nr:hypothetical protein [Candidatus Saccharimonadales bacterium]